MDQNRSRSSSDEVMEVVEQAPNQKAADAAF